VASHVWIRGRARLMHGEPQAPEAPAAEAADAEALRQVGPNDGVAQRRRELMERLNNEHRKGKSDTRKRTDESSPHFLAKWFTIHDKNSGCTMRFEWWDEEKVRSTGVANIEGTAKSSHDEEMDRSPEIIGQMLTDHNIDITKFGKDEAKTLSQLAEEVQSGAARLMLDATAHKKLVRVVDVVLLRVLSNAKDGKILVETSEQYADSRKRSICRLPGSKKKPHENTKEVAMRIVQDQLSMGNCEVRFDFQGKEVFEQEEISPSFPGVRTVYRKELVQCYVACEDPEILQRVGLPAGTSWCYEDDTRNTKFFEWMTEKQATTRKVKLKADSSEDVSGLVMAPIGLNEEDLARYLERNGVDTCKFGQNHAKTLKEFSTELIKGESSLMQDHNGDVTRVVDLVILKIMHEKRLLVQTEQTFPDKTSNQLNRLPGAKRRPDESQFLTARRILRRQLKIDENHVKLGSRNCQYFQEEKSSPGFPGIRTVYRKRLIMAELTRSDASPAA